MSKLGKKIKLRGRVFSFSAKFEKWSFYVADLPIDGKEMYRNKKYVKGVQSFCFCFLKYAKLVAFSLPSRRRS